MTEQSSAVDVVIEGGFGERNASLCVVLGTGEAKARKTMVREKGGPITWISHCNGDTINDLLEHIKLCQAFSGTHPNIFPVELTLARVVLLPSALANIDLEEYDRLLRRLGPDVEIEPDALEIRKANPHPVFDPTVPTHLLPPAGLEPSVSATAGAQ